MTSSGPILFWGIEIPVSALQTEHYVYKEVCEHPHSENTKKMHYNYCEKCGKQRFSLIREYTEAKSAINDRLLSARIINPTTDRGEFKYYAVLEWYDADCKIDPKVFDINNDKKNDFKLLMKKYSLWKLKNFGLYFIKNPAPTQEFYKNVMLKNGLSIDEETDDE